MSECLLTFGRTHMECNVHLAEYNRCDFHASVCNFNEKNFIYICLKQRHQKKYFLEVPFRQLKWGISGNQIQNRKEYHYERYKK